MLSGAPGRQLRGGSTGSRRGHSTPMPSVPGEGSSLLSPFGSGLLVGTIQADSLSSQSSLEKSPLVLWWTEFVQIAVDPKTPSEPDEGDVVGQLVGHRAHHPARSKAREGARTEPAPASEQFRQRLGAGGKVIGSTNLVQSGLEELGVQDRGHSTVNADRHPVR